MEEGGAAVPPPGPLPPLGVVQQDGGLADMLVHGWQVRGRQLGEGLE